MSRAAWQHGQSIHSSAKASEEPPLELGSPYCSDPNCQYRKELRKALEEMHRDNMGR